jgi:hypothetical protein
MPITGKLVGILAPTLSRLSVDQTRLGAHSSRFAFLASSLGCQLFFQKQRQQGTDHGQGGLLQLLLDLFNDRFALLPFSFPCANCILIVLNPPGG